jgi:hypothetical protein
MEHVGLYRKSRTLIKGRLLDDFVNECDHCRGIVDNLPDIRAEAVGVGSSVFGQNL